MPVGREIVLAYLAEEIPAALAWATDKGLQPEWDPDSLTFSLRLRRRSENDSVEDYLLVGMFDDYRVEPPTWRFLDPRTGDNIGAPAYPVGAWPNGSIFHTQGLICAAWSRDAYGDRGGPHANWGAATQWQTVAREHVQADTIPDMLARIYAELQLSPRRMQPLPEIQEQAA
jgi:hypothetical protein